MSKPVWTHTHTGEQGEELAECEGKYYTRHAWDHFLAAYTGKVRRVGRDRPLKFLGSDTDFSVAPANVHPWSPGTTSTTDPLDLADLFPDEPTDPMPQPVIRPRKLIASFPLKKLDPTGKFGYWMDDSMGLTVESMSSGASATIDYGVLESLREMFACNDMPSAVDLATDIHASLSSIDNSMQPEEVAHIIKAWDKLASGSKKLP